MSITQLQNNIRINSGTEIIKDMNGFYISHFFKSMYDTIDSLKSNNIFSESDSGEKIYRDFLINELSLEMSDKFQFINSTIERYVPDVDNNTSTNISA